MTPSDILMNTALGMIIKNSSKKYNFNYDELKEARIINVVDDPDEPYTEIELTFENSGTEKLLIGLEEFNDISFFKLYYNIWKNDLKYNATRWVGTGVYDVEHVELVSCEKCHFQTIHKFDYCPNCGRKIINQGEEII